MKALLNIAVMYKITLYMSITPEEILQVFPSKFKCESLQNILPIKLYISFGFSSIFRIIQNVVVI
jgi:hypothetical protein